MLTRDQLLAARDHLQREVVVVPELGGELMLWEMTGAERNSYDSELSSLSKSGTLGGSWRTLLLVRSIKDEQGTPLFTAGDIEQLGAAMPSTVMVSLWERAARLSKVTLEDVQELRKNSAGGPKGGTASGSPNASE